MFWSMVRPKRLIQVKSQSRICLKGDLSWGVGAKFPLLNNLCRTKRESNSGGKPKKGCCFCGQSLNGSQAPGCARSQVMDVKTNLILQVNVGEYQNQSRSCWSFNIPDEVQKRSVEFVGRVRTGDRARSARHVLCHWRHSS